MKKSIFFLFGKEATTIYLEECKDNIQPLIDGINEDGISYATFEFVEGETSPVRLLMEYQGWEDYAKISEEEYKQLFL
jgi:hypothetical protein